MWRSTSLTKLVFNPEVERTTVVDFCFEINLTDLLPSPSSALSAQNSDFERLRIWNIESFVPAYRGGRKLEVEKSEEMDHLSSTSSYSTVSSSIDKEKQHGSQEHTIRRLRVATPDEEAKWKGLASTIENGIVLNNDTCSGWSLEEPGKVQAALRNWAEDFCLSSCQFKTFTFRKVRNFFVPDFCCYLVFNGVILKQVIHGWDISTLRDGTFSSSKSHFD